jgi:hypothetical protein
LVFASIDLSAPGLPATLHDAEPKNQKARLLFLASIVSEKGMAKSRHGSILNPVWLKCFRGVADVPQIFALS